MSEVPLYGALRAERAHARQYRATSLMTKSHPLIRICLPLMSYWRPTPGALHWSQEGGGVFLVSEVIQANAVSKGTGTT